MKSGKFTRISMVLSAAFLGATTAFAAGDQAKKMKQGQDYQVLEFKKGSSELTDSAKKNIRNMIQNAKASGKIEQAHVAVWSDKQTPKEQGADLSEKEQDLAKKRSETVENYLQDQLKVSSVETHSLAEKDNWFAKAFTAPESQLNSMFSSADAPENVDMDEFQIVKSKGGPSKAVILLEKIEGTTSGTTEETESGTTEESESGMSGSESEMDSDTTESAE
jgi:hypothetical protein